MSRVLLDARLLNAFARAVLHSTSALDFVDELEKEIERGGVYEIMIDDGGRRRLLELRVVNEDPDVMPDVDALITVLRDQYNRKWTIEIQHWNYSVEELSRTSLNDMIEKEGLVLNLCNATECTPILDVGSTRDNTTLKTIVDEDYRDRRETRIELD